MGEVGWEEVPQWVAGTSLLCLRMRSMIEYHASTVGESSMRSLLRGIYHTARLSRRTLMRDRSRSEEVEDSEGRLLTTMMFFCKAVHEIPN